MATPLTRWSTTRSQRDLGWWVALVTAGLLLTGLAVAAHARAGVASPPFTGRYRFTVDAASLLAPVVAIAVLRAVARGLHDRLPWRWLLVAGFLAALVWALSLTLVDGGDALGRSLQAPTGYLRDVPRVGDAPGAFLRHYVRDAATLSVDGRQHPPGGVLLMWSLTRLGVGNPAQLGAIVTAVGCLSVPLLAVTVRSLCSEPAARRLLPVIVLAPYAIWLTGVDAVPLALCAGGLACGMVGSEPRRTPWWAVGAGLLLGLATLFSYSAAWLGASILVGYFVRRRPLLIVIAGIAALVPLALARLAGFVWLGGLTAAQADFSVRVGPHRSWLLWSFLDLLLVLLAAGPALIPAARKFRRTPGWPLLVGAALAVLFAIGSGLSRGEAERSFLPFFPWLLVAAVAPEPADDPGGAAPAPLLLVAAGVVSAVVIRAVLQPA